ncbi:MAG: universal stress protein [Haloarculaceae archaeon]
MEIDLVLAPVDGSDRSETAAEYAVAVADRYDADLHLLYVIEERVRREIDAGRIDGDRIAENHRAFTATVRESLAEAGHDGDLAHSTATGFSQTSLRQSPGSVVLDAAEEIGADFIVVPREPGSDDPEEGIGRAALYVIEYASQPVLSV